MSTYYLTVPADNDMDAADIAKRRAREDGWKVREVLRVREVAILRAVHPQRQRRWAVEMDVTS